MWFFILFFSLPLLLRGREEDVTHLQLLSELTRQLKKMVYPYFGRPGSILYHSQPCEIELITGYL